MNKNKFEKLIEKISQKRRSAGISQDWIADKLGITPAAYRKVETGKTKLTVERLFQISEILDVPYNELLEAGNDDFQHSNNGSAKNNQHINQDHKEVYEKLLQSNEEQTALLKSMAKM